jgi:hypothetical protein
MEITSASIMFDISEQWATDGRTGAFDVQNIAAHESGHWLMLNDLYSRSCSEETMYGYAAPGETKKTTLGPGDIAGIQTIYRAQPTPTGYTVTVTVKDRTTSEALSGASVYVDGVLIGTTNDQGQLVITGVTKGLHTVTVTKTGYQTLNKQGRINQDVSVTIFLRRV